MTYLAQAIYPSILNRLEYAIHVSKAIYQTFRTVYCAWKGPRNWLSYGQVDHVLLLPPHQEEQIEDTCIPRLVGIQST